MLEQNKVSVIIPAYNRARFLPTAIESVLAQTYLDVEVIVVDDGSTDNTAEVLKGYIDKISYIYQENGGVSSARNTGIKYATGKWIAFLDSDDMWLNEKLSVQMEFVLENKIKICFTDIQIENVAGHTVRDIFFDRNSIICQIYKQPFELILGRKGGLCIVTMLIERQLLLDAGCFDENMKVAEDTKLIYYIAFEVEFGFINYPFTVINRNIERQGLIDGRTHTKNILKDYHIQILSEICQKSDKIDRKFYSIIKKMLSHLLSSKAVDYCVAGQYLDARDNAKRALLLGGNLKTYRRGICVLLIPRLVGLFFRYKKHLKLNQ